jgi:hypothetical protein
MLLARSVSPPSPAPFTSARAANARRNAQAPAHRPDLWRTARDQLWALLDPLVASGATVAVVGAGNCDDLPLTRLARRVQRIDLIDIDPRATKRAVRRAPRELRARLRVIAEDVTAGVADRIVSAAVGGRRASCDDPPPAPIGRGNYDLVLGDLLYSQLLYPALLDSSVPASIRTQLLCRQGARLTMAVVRRLHASATPEGPVVHLHDLAGWWHGNEQPAELERVLRMPTFLALKTPLVQPLGCDPRACLRTIRAPILATRLWRWPFCPGVDYLVCATVARSPAP